MKFLFFRLSKNLGIEAKTGKYNRKQFGIVIRIEITVIKLGLVERIADIGSDGV